MKYSDIEYFEQFKNISFSYLYRNYDLCYLKAMHELNEDSGADAIIVGSSHAMNGINEYEMPALGKAIQFSISSQDLFYDYLHIKKAFENGKRPIKHCLIGMGYYMIYQDVSRSQLVKHLIPNIYMHIFGEEGKHNFPEAVIHDPLSAVEYNPNIYPSELLGNWCQHWASCVIKEEGTYYNSLLSRAQANLLGVRKVKWSSLSDEQKLSYVHDRVVEGHNKHVKYTESLQENTVIINEIAKFLNEHNVTPVFFITPYTKCYNEHIYPGYKPEIFNILNELEYPVEFLDMNDFQDEFNDEDFLDSDHLNDIGAKKATILLNTFIESI